MSSSTRALAAIDLLFLRFFLWVFTSSMVLLASETAQAQSPTARECLDANEAAITSAKAGRLLDAKAHREVCAADGCPVEVRQECNERLDSLNAAIPRVQFVVNDHLGVEVAPRQVRIDAGQWVSYQREGIQVELGPHQCEVEVEATIVRCEFTATGGAQTVRVPIPQRRAQPQATLPNQSPPTDSTPVIPPVVGDGTESTPLWTTSRIAAAGVGGVAVLAFGASLVYAGQALTAKDEAQALCPDDIYCDTWEGIQAWKEADEKADSASLALAVGTAAAAGAIALWVVAPFDAELRAGIGGLEVHGRF